MEITVGDKSFTLTAAEVKAAEHGCISIKEYIENDIRNLARRNIDQIVLDHTDKQPGKLPKEEKESIVLAAPVKSAKQRQDELNAEILKKCQAMVK